MQISSFLCKTVPTKSSLLSHRTTIHQYKQQFPQQLWPHQNTTSTSPMPLSAHVIHAFYTLPSANHSSQASQELPLVLALHAALLHARRSLCKRRGRFPLDNVQQGRPPVLSLQRLQAAGQVLERLCSTKQDPVKKKSVRHERRSACSAMFH